MQYGTSSINAQIGQRTGANHEVGRKITEMCVYLGIDYKYIYKPTKTKTTMGMYLRKLTNIVGRTNQEQRDAVMLVLDYKF